VLRRIFERKMEGGEDRIMRSFISYRVIISRRMRWAEYVARIRELRNAYKILVGKPEGKRPLGRLRR
jgi:hypothetical protein